MLQLHLNLRSTFMLFMHWQLSVFFLMCFGWYGTVFYPVQYSTIQYRHLVTARIKSILKKIGSVEFRLPIYWLAPLEHYARGTLCQRTDVFWQHEFSFIYDFCNDRNAFFTSENLKNIMHGRIEMYVMRWPFCWTTFLFDLEPSCIGK